LQDITRSGVRFAPNTGAEANFISPGLIEKLGLSTAQNRLELTQNLAPVIGSKFDVGEWPDSDSRLRHWINGTRGSGKSHFTIFVVDGPWSSKRLPFELSAPWIQNNHCLTKDLADLIPNRKSFQSMWCGDSVPLLFMENAHVHCKNTDSRAADAGRILVGYLKIRQV
jgi:hypothetical protein